MLDPRLARFLLVSADLTGFDRFELAGTGMAETYLAALDRILPRDAVDRLTIDWDEPIGPWLLADPKLGPVARNIILLWYRGTWTALPDEWRTAYGASPDDADHLVSGAAYRAGLQWAAAGGHPAGADAQGYASWAAPPMASSA